MVKVEPLKKCDDVVLAEDLEKRTLYILVNRGIVDYVIGSRRTDGGIDDLVLIGKNSKYVDGKIKEYSDISPIIGNGETKRGIYGNTWYLDVDELVKLYSK